MTSSGLVDAPRSWDPIMRRILRRIAEGDVSSLDDTSTLADPSVVDRLAANRPSR
jgi:acetyl-CoA synthetase